MKIKNIKNFFKIKLTSHRQNKILYLRAILHVINYIKSSQYRKQRCFIDPPSDFFFKYKNITNFFSLPIFYFAKYLEKKNILISNNNDCNSSMGHIYPEIANLQRMRIIDLKYKGKIIWFTTSRKEILGETKILFQSEDFKILFGGIKRILLTFVAIKYPSISIDGSIGHISYSLGKKHLDRYVFYDMCKIRAQLISKTKNYYPLKSKLDEFTNKKNILLQKLKISKKYIIIQIKTFRSNGTLEPLDPKLYIKTIRYFQDNNYQVVFAGREKIPEVFLSNSVINYANSKYASAFNDYLLVGNSSLVISSPSGFSHLPEVLDKPVLVLNSHFICEYYGRRTIAVPTLLSRKSETFNAAIQHEYICKYGKRCGYFKFDDMYIFHKPTEDEIFMASKELERLIDENILSITPLQKKIRDNTSFPLLKHGMSNISHYYLERHKNFFIKLKEN
jgi:putative glycosyltransferase (TIGR04372 family)